MPLFKKVFFLFLNLAFTFLYLLTSPVQAQQQVVNTGPATNQLEQSGTSTRFETGSVNPMWGGNGEYTFNTYFIDPQGREPEFVKIYLQRGGDEQFDSYSMTKGAVTTQGTQYYFKKNLSEKNEGIYQFYFEAKIANKLIHGPSYWGEDCQPGGCGECCGVWGGPKILSTKLIEENKIYLFAKDKKDPLITYDVGKNWITSVAISPDERYVAAADNQQNLYLFDIESKKLSWKYTGEPVVDNGNLGMDKGLVVFSKDGYLAASLKGVVFLFDLKKSEPIWSYPTGAVLNGLGISDDAKFIAAGGRDTYVYLWQTDNASPVWKHKIEANGGMMGGSVIRSLAMASNGDYFVVGTSCPDRSIHVFTPKSAKPVFKAKVGVNFPVESVSISDNGQYIFAGGGGSPEDPFAAVYYQLNQQQPLWNFDDSINPVNEVAVSPNAKYCLVGSIMEGIFVNNCDNKKSLWRIKDTGYIGSLSFSATGDYFASGTGTNHVLLVSIPEKKIINDWETIGKAEASQISSSGNYVVAGTGLNRFFIISAENDTTSGAGGIDISKQKPQIVATSNLGKTNSPINAPSFWAKIKNFIVNLFNSIFHKQKAADPSAVDKSNKCGNGLCEPDIGETRDNCAQDCTPAP